MKVGTAIGIPIVHQSRRGRGELFTLYRFKDRVPMLAELLRAP